MVEITKKIRSAVDLKLIEETASKFLLSQGKRRANVSIAIIGDRKMRRLNYLYRQKDYPTDVLSFGNEKCRWPAEVEEDLGEVIINYQAIKRQAKKYSRSVRSELLFILVHGLLHLIGYNDNTDKDRWQMIKKGERLLAKFSQKSK